MSQNSWLKNMNKLFLHVLQKVLVLSQKALQNLLLKMSFESNKRSVAANQNVF